MSSKFLKSIPLLSTFLLFAQSAWAQSLDAGLDSVARVSQLNFGGTTITPRLGIIIAFLLGFIGVFFFGILLYAGLLYMIGFDDKAQITKAKTMIRNGIIGLGLVMIAAAVANFILGAVFTGGAIQNQQNAASQQSANQQQNNCGGQAVPNPASCVSPNIYRCAGSTWVCGP